MRKLLELLRGVMPQSLFTAIRAQRTKPRAETAGLYILHIDFKATLEVRENLEASFEPLKRRGIDLIVLEPGMRLTRFDDV